MVKRSDHSKSEAAWYTIAHDLGISIPTLLSYDQDTITTQFVDGKSCLNARHTLDILSKFKNSKSLTSATFNDYIKRIELHLNNLSNIVGGNNLISSLKTIDVTPSFNHGDFSVDNMIEKNGILYLIDPIFSSDLFQSYVLDAAKHLFSILYYHLDSEFYTACRTLYEEHLNIDSYSLDILIAAESIRVAGHRSCLSSLSNNLICSLVNDV